MCANTYMLVLKLALILLKFVLILNHQLDWSNEMAEKEEKTESNKMFLGLYLYDELADQFIKRYHSEARKSTKHLPISEFVRNILRMHLEEK